LFTALRGLGLNEASMKVCTGLVFFCLPAVGGAAYLVCDLLFSNRLPGGGITFFAAAKKVIKESSFLQPDTAA
jgi:hypothetical protein